MAFHLVKTFPTRTNVLPIYPNLTSKDIFTLNITKLSQICSTTPQHSSHISLALRSHELQPKISRSLSPWPPPPYQPPKTAEASPSPTKSISRSTKAGLQSPSEGVRHVVVAPRRHARPRLDGRESSWVAKRRVVASDHGLWWKRRHRRPFACGGSSSPSLPVSSCSHGRRAPAVLSSTGNRTKPTAVGLGISKSLYF